VLHITTQIFYMRGNNMNWTKVRIIIQMVILVTLGIWAMNCEITCCKKDKPPDGCVVNCDGDQPICGDGICQSTETAQNCPSDCSGTTIECYNGFLQGSGTSNVVNNNLVDWTSPIHGQIMRPPLTYLFIHFLTEENDNPNDDIDRNSFSVADDVSVSVSWGNVDISIQEVNTIDNWGWGGVFMVINGGGTVGQTYTFKIKNDGATPIRTKNGTTMNNPVVVKVTLANGDGVAPTVVSSTFDSLNLNFVPPHQPVEYNFSEPMEGGRIPWLATNQGGQSVVSALNNPFGQVQGYYDHFGGKNRLTIFSLGGGLDIDTDYEYTIPGDTGIDPEVYKYITPTTDGSGMKMPNTYTKRFHTSKVKITEPKSQNVTVLQGCNEWQMIPTITSLPVSVSGITAPGVDFVLVSSTTGETSKSTSTTPGTTGNTFSTNFYFKQPGKKELRVTGFKQYREPITGAKYYLPYGGEDYIKLNVQSPPPQNWLALELNEDLTEAVMGSYPWFPGGETLLGFTIPYGCYDDYYGFLEYDYHLYANKSIYQFNYLDEAKIKENYDIYLLDDQTYNGYFIGGAIIDVSVDISSIPIEINTTYTNIPPIIKPPSPPPPPPGVDCFAEENIWSCRPECIRCVDGHEPYPPPDFMHPPDSALWKGIGKKIHVILRTKETNIECGYVSRSGIEGCEENLANAGSRIEGFNVEYDLIPALLITTDASCNIDNGIKCTLPKKIPSPPYRPFLLIRNFKIGDIGNVEMPCIMDWIVEEMLEWKFPKSNFEDSYQIDLQSTPEWGTFYFTGNIQVQEEFTPHKIRVYFEYLPGFRDN
jgi:hypothetical protein